jgi:hypothetical protein
MKERLIQPAPAGEINQGHRDAEQDSDNDDEDDDYDDVTNRYEETDVSCLYRILVNTSISSLLDRLSLWSINWYRAAAKSDKSRWIRCIQSSGNFQRWFCTRVRRAISRGSQYLVLPELSRTRRRRWCLSCRRGCQ